MSGRWWYIVLLFSIYHHLPDTFAHERCGKRTVFKLWGKLCEVVFFVTWFDRKFHTIVSCPGPQWGWDPGRLLGICDW